MESASCQRVESFLCLVFHLLETASTIPKGTRDDTEGFLRVVNSEV